MFSLWYPVVEIINLLHRSGNEGDKIMTKKDEQLQTELSTLLEEYRTLKTEIVSNLASGREIATLTLTTIGILVAAAPFIINLQVIIIFLIVPLLFYILAWSQLRYTYLVLDMGAYLRSVIVPKIHWLIKEVQVDKERDISYLMSWEFPGKGPSRLRQTKLLKILFLPIAGANYGIPLLAAVLSVSTFLILTFQTSRIVSIVEILLIVVNIIALIYSAFWGYLAELCR